MSEGSKTIRPSFPSGRPTPTADRQTDYGIRPLRMKALIVTAEVIVDVFRSLEEGVSHLRVKGIPADVRVVGTYFSFEHPDAITILLESQEFELIPVGPEGQAAPPLILEITKSIPSKAAWPERPK